MLNKLDNRLKNWQEFKLKNKKKRSIWYVRLEQSATVHPCFQEVCAGWTWQNLLCAILGRSGGVQTGQSMGQKVQRRRQSDGLLVLRPKGTQARRWTNQKLHCLL